MLAALLAAGCYGPTPKSVREHPRSEAQYAAPYLTLARCALREYETVVEVPEVELREFPDDGYAEVIVGRPWVSALSEFRRIDERHTAAVIYSRLLVGRGDLTTRLETVNRECADGARSNRSG